MLTLLVLCACLGYIRVITGKPGGGKSYWAVKEVIEELRWGSRVIVTNLSLDLGELAAYLQAIDPDAPPIDLHKRVRILTEDESRHFYAHREYGCDFDVPTDEETKRGKRIDYGEISKLQPVMYVIDEAHVLFDARSWQTSGPHLTYYNSQHRKPGDEVFFVTQFVGLLDKRCTGFAQEFIECRNFGLERLLMFRGPKGQHVANFTLTPPGKGTAVMVSTYFRLDLKIAKCYNTTGGVGMIAGRDAKPREKETKGLNPIWGIAAALAVIAFLWWLPDLLTKVVLKGVDKTTHLAAAAAQRATPTPEIPGRGDASTAPVAGLRSPFDPQQPRSVAPRLPVVRGVVVRGDALWVSVEGRGWLPVVAREGDLVILGDGTKVSAVDVLAGRTETTVAAK